MARTVRPALIPGRGTHRLDRGRLVATGLVAGFLLAAAPFLPAEEGAVTGAVLCGFALGWAMLAVLWVRFTDQPQRWAAAPALSMGLGGLLLVGVGSPVDQVLNWVWPPAMPALAVWMIVRPSTASEPEQALAALPGDRDVGAGLVGRRLSDPG